MWTKYWHFLQLCTSLQAWKNWREGTASNLIDPTLNTGSRNEMMRCIHIGLLCVQGNLADRPTMASVALMLNSYSQTLPVPSEPAFFMHSRGLSDIQSREYNSGATESKSKSVKAYSSEESTWWALPSIEFSDTALQVTFFLFLFPGE